MKSTEIINQIGLECVNTRAFNLRVIKSPDEITNECFTLLTRVNEFDDWFNSKTPEDVLAVIPEELKEKAINMRQSFILSKNPRLDFVKGMHILMNKPFIPNIASTAVIESEKQISKNIIVGDHVVIKGNVEIGDNCEIYDNVVITGNVKIGNNVRIKSGTIIGQKGFNFVYDEHGKPLEFIHIGGVVIGDNVEFGALNTVVQGTLGNTIISDDVKTDDHVHIAHNVKVGKGTLLTACTEISGSVTIGENTWLGPNCSIIDHIKIGSNVTIGIGAVVLKSVADNAIVVGNPGKILKYKE